MATWNQGINSGGFLGGIGQVNDNAPRASDINPTLGLIRENNELARSGANNWGLQAMQGLAGIADVYKQQQAQERLKEFQGKWGQAMANNDTDTMKGLFAEYPEMEAQIGKGMDGINADVRKSMSDLALGYHAAVVSGKPEEFIRANADKMRQYGFDPQVALSMAKENPNAAREYAVGLGMMAEGSPELFINKINADENRKVTVRGQDVSAETARRGQDISAATARRGQDISAQNSIRSANAQAAAPSSVREYEYLQSLSPEQRKQFMQLKGKSGDEMQQAQLSNGQTVMIDPKALGAGEFKYYKGYDANGNVVTIPVKALSSTSQPEGMATNNMMNSDMQKLLNADDKKLSSITGITGGAGKLPLTSDYLTKFNDDETRDLYNSAERVLGNMQNMSIEKAKAMGASGINTIPELEIYKKGLPQPDFSSPRAIKETLKAVDQYNKDFNSGKNANLNSKPQPQQAMQQAPQAAIQALQQNPSLAPQFRAKYGYLP